LGVAPIRTIWWSWVHNPQKNNLGVVETKNQKIHVHARTRWWVSEHEHGIGHEQHMGVVMVHKTLGQHGSIKCELTWLEGFLSNGKV
jgi:hypothetical protein